MKKSIDINLFILKHCSKGQCVVVKEDNFKNLKKLVSIQANISNEFLFNNGTLIFEEKINNLSERVEIGYLVINNMDKADFDMQDRFVGLIKDREFNGYKLPENIIIALTIENEDNFNKLSDEIRKLALMCM
ncbi:MAG: hypothetical protein ACI4T1_01190 [Christensenellales bacterium]